MFDENDIFKTDDTEIPEPPIDDSDTDVGDEDEIPADPPSDIPCVIKLKRRFPDVEWRVLTDAYEKAKTTLLDAVFPFKLEVVEIPENMPRLERWVYDCAVEILAINNIANGMPLTMYKENGITMEWDSSMMSETLRKRLPPPWVKVIGRK